MTAIYQNDRQFFPHWHHVACGWRPIQDWKCILQLGEVTQYILQDIHCKLSNQLPYLLVTCSLSLKFIPCFMFMSGKKQSFVFGLPMYQQLFPAMAALAFQKFVCLRHIILEENNRENKETSRVCRKVISEKIKRQNKYIHNVHIIPCS